METDCVLCELQTEFSYKIQFLSEFCMKFNHTLNRVKGGDKQYLKGGDEQHLNGGDKQYIKASDKQYFKPGVNGGDKQYFNEGDKQYFTVLERK